VKTLQSIKKGIDLLDARRTDLRVGEQNGTEEPENGWAPEPEYDDEEAELPVRR
jgi:hypothetical protein